METSPFIENKDTTYDWLEGLRTDALAGRQSIEDLLALLKEKPIVYIIILNVMYTLKLQYTEEINEKVIEAMERYEHRNDIKELIYLRTKQLLKNGKA